MQTTSTHNQIINIPESHLPQNFTEPEAARWLKISRVTLQRIRLRGEIGFVRVGGTRVVYRLDDLVRYLAAHERKPFHKS